MSITFTSGDRIFMRQPEDIVSLSSQLPNTDNFDKDETNDSEHNIQNGIHNGEPTDHIDQNFKNSPPGFHVKPMRDVSGGRIETAMASISRASNR